MLAKTLALTALLLAFNPSALWAGDDRTAIHEDATLVQPLLPGMQAPAFKVRTVKGEIFRFDPEALLQPLPVGAADRAGAAGIDGFRPVVHQRGPA